MNLSPGELNFIEKDTVIYKQGDLVDTIGFVTEGSVIKSTMQTSEEVSPGHFIGVHSLYTGSYSSTFVAHSDVRIRAIKANSPSSLADFLVNNQQLHEKVFIDLSILITQLYEMYNKLYTQSVILYKCTESICAQFKILSHKSNLECEKTNDIKAIEEYSFASMSFYNNYLNSCDYLENPEKAYVDMCSGKADFYTSQIDLIKDIYSAYDQLVKYALILVEHLSGRSESSILNSIVNLISFMKSNELEKDDAIALMKKIMETIKTIEFSLKRKCLLSVKIDYFYINTCIKNAISDSLPEKPLAKEITVPTALIGSLKHILDYAGYNEEASIEFAELVQGFLNIKDKQSKEDENRKIFRKITEKYYELYENVFLKYVNDTEPNQILDLFLDFGFLDEKLLTPEELNLLIKIENLKDSSPCKIYRMKEWLTVVYSGQEYASKNEFDEDYVDFVRHEKKEKGLTKIEEKKLLDDPVLRVQFEIRNMFKYNNRLLSGNMLAFVPFLHSEGFDSTMEKMILSSETVNSLISSIRDIDYSLFYREFMYADTSAKIDKEMIQKEVFPIIILFPVAGVNGMMWQETTRKRSDSAGRFFLPTFFAGNLEDTLLKILGRFRWELCKQMLGTSWNNIQVPSLTSKYSDYVQFYKNERELSADKKESIKNQISKCRNKMSEVFVVDYITWIKHESSGAIRLNPVARRILSTHCPFNKETREKLMQQPLFEKAMLRYNLDKAKKIKEMRNRSIALERKKATITKEILDTQHFYNDL